MSQYCEWGANKTDDYHGNGNRGHNWDGVGKPPQYYFDTLARTYAPRVVGKHVRMQFNSTTSYFELEYEVGSTDPDLATEIYVLAARYPDGPQVKATARKGAVRVVYNEKLQLVNIFAGEGLSTGDRVTVKISKDGKEGSLRDRTKSEVFYA